MRNTSNEQYKHPQSSHPDGRYYLKNVLVIPGIERKDSELLQSNLLDNRYDSNKINIIPGTRPVYPEELAKRIKLMSTEEKQKIQCLNCGQYNHNANDCRAPGKQCYRCFNYGHTGSICPINPIKSKYIRSDFVFETTFAIDSASNAHLTNDRSSLIDYIELQTQRDIYFNLSGKIVTAKAIGIGKLPLLLKWRKNETIAIVNNFYYAPTTEEKIIGANAFNIQFCSSITLNIKSGHIFARKLNTQQI